MASGATRTLPNQAPPLPARRWGLGVRKKDNQLRFCTFSVLHLGTYLANVSVVILLGLALQVRDGVQFGLAACVVLLSFALSIVGIYCAHLSWRDTDVKRISETYGGFIGRVLTCTFLGLTQLIQLKVAYSNYALLEEMPVDHESDSDGGEVNGHPPQDVNRRREVQRVAMLRNSSPRAFPAKCFEGILEGSVFALVTLYVMLKAGWNGAEPLVNISSLTTSDFLYFLTYFLLTMSGLLSFATVGISMLNFDYHLSPAVQKVVDHSMRYTILHAIFRGCESASRVVMIVVLILGFRSCDAVIFKIIPYLIFLTDYIVCIVLLRTLSAAEERRHRTNDSCAKSILSAMFMGMLLVVANLAEFVDEAERGVLQAAAAKFSTVIRSLRFLELVTMIFFLCYGFPCDLVLDDSHGEPLPPIEVRKFLFIHHFLIIGAFGVASIIYWLSLWRRFHRLALWSSRHQVISPVVARLLDLPNPRCYLEECEETQLQVPEISVQGREVAISMTSSTTSSRRLETRRVLIAQGSDNDLPDSLRVDVMDGGTQTLHFNSQDEFRLRQASGLTSLLMSRGFVGPLASLVLTRIDENRTDENAEACETSTTDAMNRALAIDASDVTRMLQRHGNQFQAKGSQAEVWIQQPPHAMWTYEKGRSLIAQLGERTKPDENKYYTALLIFVDCIEQPRKQVPIESPISTARPPQPQMKDFEVLEQVGKGSYAPVCKCKLKRTGEVFAMKRLMKNHYCVEMSLWESVMVAREKDTLLLSGRHTHVASLEWAFELDNYWVLIMEFCNLGSLNKFIKSYGEPGLDVQDTRRLGQHILLGLDHLHQHQILHRDVKPENVGIAGPADDATAKLIDFGFAKCADACQSKTIIGSYGYCAPEIDEARMRLGKFRQAETYYDERIDLYSYGVLLFVMFVGREAANDDPRGYGPFWNHHQFRLMLANPDDDLWQCNRYVNAGVFAELVHPVMEDCGLLDAISKLTETNPQDRPRTAHEAATLRFFLDESSFPAGSLRSNMTERTV